MKKIIISCMILFTTLSINACKEERENKKEKQFILQKEIKMNIKNATYTQNKTGNKKILIAYFSRSGNTKKIADYIQENTGGDLFEIEVLEKYPSEYRKTTDQAKKELAEDFRPKLKTSLNIEPYDIVFIGYPIWWGTVPQAVKVFILDNNFLGKTIVPFATHGGSGLASSATDIKKYSNNTNVLSAFVIRGEQVNSAQSLVKDWLNKLQLSTK